MCSIALLRSGRTPKIKPIDEFRLLPIKTIGDIAEETHFYIDYSRNYAVVCIEYNHNGPRMKDVEYYLRNVARNVLKLSENFENYASTARHNVTRLLFPTHMFHCMILDFKR